MKELLNGILILLGAVLVTITFPIMFVYQIGYIIYFTFKQRDLRILIVGLCLMLDGLLACLGHVLKHIGVALDMAWNVCGEILEDMFTPVESTYFGRKNITVSASIGDLENRNKLNGLGKWFSKLLNFVFNEKEHAKYAITLYNFNRKFQKEKKKNIKEKN